MIPISIQQKLQLIDEPWKPKTIASLNNYQVELARIEGEFICHSHDDTDELFLVVEGLSICTTETRLIG